MWVTCCNAVLLMRLQCIMSAIGLSELSVVCCLQGSAHKEQLQTEKRLTGLKVHSLLSSKVDKS